MIYEKDGIAVRLLDVMELDQGGVSTQNKPRPHSALSFRIEADTTLTAAGEVHHLRDGAVSFVPAGLAYRRDSRRDRLFVLHLEVLDYTSDRIEVLRPHSPERLEALFRTVCTVWQRRESGYRHRATAILHDILAECCRQSVPEEKKTSKIGASVEYIRAHFTDPALTVAEIARESYMSEVYLRRLFKEEYGTSPRRYVVDLRIRRAVALLSSGYHTLKEAAYLSGFTAYKYFTTVFKRQTGLSPSDYVGRGAAADRDT